MSDDYRTDYIDANTRKSLDKEVIEYINEYYRRNNVNPSISIGDVIPLKEGPYKYVYDTSESELLDIKDHGSDYLFITTKFLKKDTSLESRKQWESFWYQHL
ncbi:MAG: hypothetical protein K6D59_01710 [Bacteroidales bacterium]|nr:hypothetical protein [Bacteroidales bacterium]